jgi:DNA-binding MarR family transcriptional regulator
MRQYRLNKEQVGYLSDIANRTNPSTCRLGNGFDPLLKRGLIEDKTPLSDVCDGFRLTQKGKEALRRAEPFRP